VPTRTGNRTELARFLRSRREALTPAQVGLAPGVRRRTPGLRRDEVAELASMSTNYYERLEQARGPRPSPTVHYQAHINERTPNGKSSEGENRVFCPVRR
jgi:transcriptional regulator with XRE-family HTH domain